MIAAISVQKLSSIIFANITPHLTRCYPVPPDHNSILARGDALGIGDFTHLRGEQLDQVCCRQTGRTRPISSVGEGDGVSVGTGVTVSGGASVGTSVGVSIGVAVASGVSVAPALRSR